MKLQSLGILRVNLVQEIEEKLRKLRIETPVNHPNTNEILDKNLIMNLVVFGAFYPNYFFNAYNVQREKDAFR